jgi:hypothetical protein
LRWRNDAAGDINANGLPPPDRNEAEMREMRDSLNAAIYF